MGDFKSGSKFSKFIAGKGFYVALAVCVIGTAAAAWVALDPSGGSESSRDMLSQSSSVQRDFPLLEDANQPVKDVKISSSSSSVSSRPSVSSSSSSKASSSSVGSSASAGSSSQQTFFQKQQPQAFVLPLVGEVFVPFSNGELVKNVTLGEWRTHDGVDIKADKGTPVKAVADGTVVKVTNDPMWGTVMEIEHTGSLVSVYSGLAQDVKVKAGDKVKIDQEIGTVEEIPAEISLESHLHFAVKKDGKWVDPLAAIGKTRS